MLNYRSCKDVARHSADGEVNSRIGVIFDIATKMGIQRCFTKRLYNGYQNEVVCLFGSTFVFLKSYNILSIYSPTLLSTPMDSYIRPKTSIINYMPPFATLLSATSPVKENLSPSQAQSTTLPTSPIAVHHKCKMPPSPSANCSSVKKLLYSFECKVCHNPQLTAAHICSAQTPITPAQSYPPTTLYTNIQSDLDDLGSPFRILSWPVWEGIIVEKGKT
jgi:hypothetical protein